MNPRSAEIGSVRPRRVKIAATRGLAALVPTTRLQPPVATEYSAIPPPLMLDPAAAARSTESRVPHDPKLLAPNAVWKAGIGNSVLQPLPPAPPCAPSFHTT